MKGALPMDIYLVSLLVQGGGGLFLVLVCCTLYGQRRRTYFLDWTLAWFCFTLWLLLGGIKMEWEEYDLGWPALRSWIQDVAAVGGWWHAAFWVFGLRGFWRRRTRTGPGTGP